MADHRRQSIARSLGAFVGHIWKGIKTPAPDGRQTIEHGRRVEEARPNDDGTLVFRRTTIEEVEFRQEDDRR